MDAYLRRIVIVALAACWAVAPADGRADTTLAAASTMVAPSWGAAGQTAGLPRVLSPSDVVLYRQMFLLGDAGQWSQVDALAPKLEDRLLLGHVMAQRYLHRVYRSQYAELSAWLASHADHPDAETIYKLALGRAPAGDAAATASMRLPDTMAAPTRRKASSPDIPLKHMDGAGEKQASALKKEIRRAVWKDQNGTAIRLIQSGEASQLLGAVELDDMRARVGQGYFVDGDDALAIEWAGGAAGRSGLYLPSAHWTAGLAAWRSRDFDRAAKHFEALAVRRDLSPWMASAGAFWAARTRLVANQPQQVNRWLTVAASYPGTFYGLLARHILGAPMPFQWNAPGTEQAGLDALARSTAGRRALALIEVGEQRRAEREFDVLAGRESPDVDRGIIVAASRAGMPHVALRLHDRVFPNGGGIDATAYPVPPWSPHGGFAVDRALVYAVIRQESRFNPKATSSAGARGLMQLMPATASYVARGTGYNVNDRDTLYEPGVNLSLGQKYIQMLLGNGGVDGDLFKLATAWNGGPGNLQNWHGRVNHMNDPLLFIESIPAGETRNFIERVLANLWIYRHRFGQPTPALDALAAGRWPAYRPQDNTASRVATYGAN